MLKNIIIKNLALIKEADIELEKGLNILTGETGAGKSIIISSVNMALGEKANKAMIRKDSDQAYIELLFTGVNDKVLEKLSEFDIDIEDTDLIVSRKLSGDSSISKINGRNVTLSVLKEITSLLVDIHGQHDHQSLLDPSKHIDFIDQYGGEKINALKKELKKEHANYRQLRIKYKDYDKTEEELDHDISLAKYELDEIERVALKEGEDKALEEEFKKLMENENISKLILNAHNLFIEDSGILERISDASKLLSDANAISDDMKDLKSVVMDLEALANDLSKDLERACEQNRYDPERIEQVGERLNEINKLKSKYGSDFEKINAYKSELINVLDAFENYFEEKERLEKDIHDSAERLNELSTELSLVRKKVIDSLEPEISDNLKELNFLQAGFKISQEKNDRIGENGFDNIEFFISLNPGEAYMPLAKIASGGEISRIMLAIKTAMAKNDSTETLIFDEIDSGISGKTAHMTAEMLYNLSKEHQIICISHLPQIASMADTHYHIHKEVDDGDTISGVHRLNDEQMIKEIAILLGGATISNAAMENARDLKGNANFYKRKLR